MQWGLFRYGKNVIQYLIYFITISYNIQFQDKIIFRHFLTWRLTRLGDDYKWTHIHNSSSSIRQMIYFSYRTWIKLGPNIAEEILRNILSKYMPSSWTKSTRLFAELGQLKKTKEELAGDSSSNFWGLFWAK